MVRVWFLAPVKRPAPKARVSGAASLRIDGLGRRQELLVGGHEHRDVARKGLRKGRKFNFHSIPSLFAGDFSPLRRYGASSELRPMDAKFGVASRRGRQYQYRPSKREWK